MPTLISDFKLTSSTATSQLLNIPVAVIALITSIATGWFLDNDTRVPRPAIMIGSIITLAGLYFGLIFCRVSGALYALILLSFIPVSVSNSDARAKSDIRRVLDAPACADACWF